MSDNLPGEFIENEVDAQVAQMMNQLVVPGDNVDLLTEIPEDAIIPLVKMKLKARIRRCDDIDYAVNQYLRMMVSKNRLGRSGIEKILEQVLVGLKDAISGMRDMVREHQ